MVLCVCVCENNTKLFVCFLQPSSRSSRVSGWACRVTSPAQGAWTDLTETFLNSENQPLPLWTDPAPPVIPVTCVDFAAIADLPTPVNKLYTCLCVYLCSGPTPIGYTLSVSRGGRTRRGWGQSPTVPVFNPDSLPANVSGFFVTFQMCSCSPLLFSPPSEMRWRSFESEGFEVWQVCLHRVHFHLCCPARRIIKFNFESDHSVCLVSEHGWCEAMGVGSAGDAAVAPFVHSVALFTLSLAGKVNPFGCFYFENSKIEFN